VEHGTTVYAERKPMHAIDGRFWVKLISSQALAQYMKYRDVTVRELAAKVGCAPAVIGHLRSGRRNACKPETAKLIEKYLDAPKGSLFVPQVSPVFRNTSQDRIPA
jgi:transcriptional regulator with XRE-family HTH domain